MKKVSLFLYLISQDANNDWDSYDSAVVCAPDERTAQNMNPDTGDPVRDWTCQYNAWAPCPEAVKVKLIGKAAPEQTVGVIVASFNAGG